MSDARFSVLCALALSAQAAQAFGATATASSGANEFDALSAVDGNRGTRWSTEFSDPQWLEIDYGESKDLVGVLLHWENAYASGYELLVSDDGREWSEVFRTGSGDGGLDDVDFARTRARYLKLVGTRRGTAWGYSLFEVIPKTAAEPWGEGEPGGYFLRDTGGRPSFTNRFFVPASWSNRMPFLQLTDAGGALDVRVGAAMMTNIAPGRKVRLPLGGRLRFGDWNTVAVRAPDGGPRSVLLAGGEADLELGLREQRKRDHKEYYRQLGRMEPEGYFPYWLTGRQGFWTAVGADGGDFKESLLCEDGSLEPYKSFSITPFLFLDGRLVTRADARLEQSLEQGYLPIPAVTWRTGDVELRVSAFAAGPAGASTTYARYDFANRGADAVRGKLYLAARPFEINPPWQWGGYTRIHDVKYPPEQIAINEFRLVPLTPPSAFGATAADGGDITRFLERGTLPAATNLHDNEGLASAAVEYAFDLEPSQTVSFALAIPLHTGSVVAAAAELERLAFETARYWSSRVDRVRFEIPDREMDDCARASLAYLLINRDGPAIQPGPRAYEAAWMRDGAMSSATLLRFGFAREVREFLDWYARFIYEDGRVPAIVIIGRNEVNPVHEYDSQGQFVYACLQYYRFTKDRAFLEAKWPAVLKVLRYLESLRDRDLAGPPPADPGQLRYYGILPKSVSHEGYYPEPGNHSYWDNFWGVRGWRDAAVIARVLGQTNALPWIRREEKELRHGLLTSLRAAMEHCRIDFIPGCAELCDFDPSSTAIALTSCDVARHLPGEAWTNTFERYWRGVEERMRPGWTGSFSPYEFRIAQAFIQMDRRDRALALMDFLMGYRRPAGWRQWPEAVYAPADAPGYIGDMPHTWAASGFLAALRAMFIHEDERAGALVLGAGIPESWLEGGETVALRDAPTYWGTVTIEMQRVTEGLSVELTGTARPPGGIRLRWPLAAPLESVAVDGEPARPPSGREVFVEKIPARLLLAH